MHYITCTMISRVDLRASVWVSVDCGTIDFITFLLAMRRQIHRHLPTWKSVTRQGCISIIQIKSCCGTQSRRRRFTHIHFLEGCWQPVVLVSMGTHWYHTACHWWYPAGWVIWGNSDCISIVYLKTQTSGTKWIHINWNRIYKNISSSGFQSGILIFLLWGARHITLSEKTCSEWYLKKASIGIVGGVRN